MATSKLNSSRQSILSGNKRRASALARSTALAGSLGLIAFAAGCTSDSDPRSAYTGEVLPAHFETIESRALRVDLAPDMQTRISILEDGKPKALTGFDTAFHVSLDSGDVIEKFTITNIETTSGTTDSGPAQITVVMADAVMPEGQDGSVEARFTFTASDALPDVMVVDANYTNTGVAPLRISRWTNNDHTLLSTQDAEGPAFWSFQGASYVDRRDWVQPLDAGFEQLNFMGMNSSDYGNGTPVIDVWRRDAGLAVGHVETVPKLVSLPVIVNDSGANLEINYDSLTELAPGESLDTFETFVSVHQGDFYATMKSYRNAMAQRGMPAPEFPDSAYEAIWCAWGYERGFTVDEVLATLPKVKEMGLKWAVLDDGWQTSEGDWYLDKTKFPDGDASMKAFVDEIKAAGLKAKLWLAPLIIDPGTDLMRYDTDMLLLNEWGQPQLVTWWNGYYMCPAYEPAVENTLNLVRRIMSDWGYQGLKIDGQHLNGAGPCYNEAHNHERPEESVEAMQTLWKRVYETAMEIDPEAVVEICPCGTSYAFHNLPYMNQTVASDPLSSWQIRHKGKMLRGVTSDSAAYYADHVELSDDANDFATTLGIGAVLGTKFTWPKDGHPELGFTLTSEKEMIWKKWIDLYNENMLSKGIYRGELYDIGFDRPEAHAIQKDDVMFYGFYAEEHDGAIELRGLSEGTFTITDYENDVVLGDVTGPVGTLDTRFTGHLLIKAEMVGL